MPARSGSSASTRATARALLQLGVAGTVGVTSLAEAVHQAVLATTPIPWRPHGPVLRALTSAAYSGVRGVVGAVGRGGDSLLRGADDAAFNIGGGQRSEDLLLPLSWQSVLNGVIGDRLAALGNAVALPMSIQPHRDHRSRAHRRDAGGERVLFIHGLCMNDQQWQTPASDGEDFGARLVRDAGYRPLYLRYNSGLPIAESGRLLADLLESRHSGRHAWQEPWHVVAHSMGGLLIRSAMAQGIAKGHRWPDRLHHLVFLGTPHHGAPLERLGTMVDTALALNRFSSPWKALGKLRSVAIQDLGHAQVDAWAARPDRLQMHAVAGTLERASGRRLPKLLGDGLVPVESALWHREDETAGGIATRRVFHGVGHLSLIQHPEVADHLATVIV